LFFEKNVRERFPEKKEETMYFSRVITGRIDPQKYEKAFSIFTDNIIPAAREQDGFRGANLFTNQQTGKFIAATIWKTEEDMMSSDNGGYLKGQLDKVSDFFTETPVIEYFNVLY
jgi:heme-degrading monooxygenase HmoA